MGNKVNGDSFGHLVLPVKSSCFHFLNVKSKGLQTTSLYLRCSAYDVSLSMLRMPNGGTKKFFYPRMQFTIIKHAKKIQDFLMTFAQVYSCWHIFSMQTHGNCFHQILQDEQQLFLVETWSDCSGSRHHQGPMMLEPTIVNSTVTLVIPHLLPKCHIMATIKNQELSNPPKNITFG